jgi:hypothetical protein
VLVVAVAAAVAEAERSRRISAALVRLRDTSAQIRVRGAFVLLIGMVALAEQLGLELILDHPARTAMVTTIAASSVTQIRASFLIRTSPRGHEVPYRGCDDIF